MLFKQTLFKDKQMSRLVKISAALILVLAALLVLNLGSGLKTLVETLGPEMTQSSVTLHSAKISLLSGQGSFKGLHIGNPQGFDTEEAFSLGEIRFKLDQDSLATDIIVLESLTIMAPQVTLERGSGGSNLDRLQQNIAGYLGPADTEDNSDQATKNIIIRDVLITDGKLRYGLLGSKTLDLPLPEIHLSNLGEEGQGISIAEAGAAIIAAISRSATQVALESGSIKDTGDKLEAQIKDKVSKIKDLFKK